MARKKIKPTRNVDTLIRRVERERREEFDPNSARNEMDECDWKARSGTDRLFDKIEAVETFVKDLRREAGNVRGHQNRIDDLKNALEEFEFSGKSVWDRDRRDRRRGGDRDRREARRA